MFVPFSFIPIFYILYSMIFLYYENNRAFCIYYGVRVERQFMVKSDVSKNIRQQRVFLPGYFYVSHSYFCIALDYFCAVFKFSIFISEIIFVYLFFIFYLIDIQYLRILFRSHYFNLIKFYKCPKKSSLFLRIVYQFQSYRYSFFYRSHIQIHGYRYRLLEEHARSQEVGFPITPQVQLIISFISYNNRLSC